MSSLSLIFSGSVAGAAVRLLQRAHDGVEVERCRLLPRRERLEVGDLSRHQPLHPIEDVGVRDDPIPVGIRILVRPFERIAPQWNILGALRCTKGSNQHINCLARCSIRTTFQSFIRTFLNFFLERDIAEAGRFQMYAEESAPRPEADVMPKR